MREMSAATHEIGHAMMMHLVGFGVKSVTLDENGVGRCLPETSEIVETDLDLAKLQVALAGEIAELLPCFWHLDSDFERFQLTPDYADAVAALDRNKSLWQVDIGGISKGAVDIREALMLHVEPVYMALLKHIDAIEVLSEMLFDRGFIDGEEFREALQSCP